MDDNEVNKIIAEFEMGQCISTDKDLWKHFQKGSLFNYTESLDALIPAWKKLKVDRAELTFFRLCGDYGCDIALNDGGVIDVDNPSLDGKFFSIQQAAAHATAKAILEIRDNNK